MVTKRVKKQEKIMTHQQTRSRICSLRIVIHSHLINYLQYLIKYSRFQDPYNLCVCAYFLHRSYLSSYIIMNFIKLYHIFLQSFQFVFQILKVFQQSRFFFCDCLILKTELRLFYLKSITSITCLSRRVYRNIYFILKGFFKFLMIFGQPFKIFS